MKRWSVFLGATVVAVLIAVPILRLGQADSPAADEPAKTPSAVRSELHPLDPLNQDEVAAAVRVLKDEKHLTAKTRLAYLGLHEPAKKEVLAWKPGQPLDRKAFAIVFDRAANRTFETIVDLKTRKIVESKEVFGVQPPMLVEEYDGATRPVRGDPRWLKAM